MLAACRSLRGASRRSRANSRRQAAARGGRGPCPRDQDDRESISGRTLPLIPKYLPLLRLSRAESALARPYPKMAKCALCRRSTWRRISGRCLGGGLFRLVFLLGHLHEPDRNFIEEQRRNRERELTDDVGRRQHRRHHEHADDRITPLLLQPSRIGHADARKHGQNHRQLERDAEGEDQRHNQREIFGNAGQERNRRLPVAARLLHAQEEAHRERHRDEIHERSAEQKTKRRRNQIRQESRALAFIEAGRDEHINLRRDHRERQECRTEQAELDLREQEFLRRGVDQLDLGVRARGKLIRKKKNVVDLLRKEEAEEKHQEERNQRLDEPRAQLDQMLDQRRLAGVDFIIFGGHAPRSGSDFGLPAPAALSGLPGSAMLNGSSTAFRISSPVFFTSSSAVPAVASFKSFSASFFISASSISRMALENWFWKSLASLLSFPRFCATARTTPGSSFGPITTSATMPITRSSLQPMSNMALVSAGAKRRSARGERRVSSPFSRTRSAWRMKAGGRSFSDHCYGYRRRPCLPRTTLS